MDNFVVERGEFFLWIRLLTSSSSSRHSHNLAMIEKRIEDRSDVTHSTSNAFVHVHVQNTFSYVCLFMKKSFTQQTWLHHSFSVCRSTLLFSVCRTILHLSVCRTILHLSIFVELSTFVGLFLLLFSLSLSIYLTFVCLSRSFFLLRPLNKHSHKSTRMGPQFKITFLTQIFIRWMHFFFFSSPSSVFLVVINHISGKTNIPKDVGHISKHNSLVIFKL